MFLFKKIYINTKQQQPWAVAYIEVEKCSVVFTPLIICKNVFRVTVVEGEKMIKIVWLVHAFILYLIIYDGSFNEEKLCLYMDAVWRLTSYKNVWIQLIYLIRN